MSAQDFVLHRSLSHAFSCLSYFCLFSFDISVLFFLFFRCFLVMFSCFSILTALLVFEIAFALIVLIT